MNTKDTVTITLSTEEANRIFDFKKADYLSIRSSVDAETFALRSVLNAIKKLPVASARVVIEMAGSFVELQKENVKSQEALHNATALLTNLQDALTEELKNVRQKIKELDAQPSAPSQPQ